MSKYHYLVLPVKPTRNATDLQKILNVAANGGYRLIKVEEGEVYKDDDIQQLVIGENWFFEKEVEEKKSVVYSEDRVEDTLVRFSYPLVRDEKWEELEKVVEWIAIAKGIKRAEQLEETIEWLKKRKESKGEQGTE